MVLLIAFSLMLVELTGHNQAVGPHRTRAVGPASKAGAAPVRSGVA